MKKNDIQNLDWLQQIPPLSPAVALELAIDKLRQCTLNGSESMHWLLAVDQELDEKTFELALQYTHTLRLSAEEEIIQWEAGRIYHDLMSIRLAALVGDIAEKNIPVAYAPTIVARALHHRSKAALWRHLRYVPFPQGWWLETHTLFAFAEREQIATTEITYSNGQMPTHARGIYLQLLLLDTLNRTSLTKKQIFAISSWLTNQTDALPLEKDFDEEHQLFYVNLDEDRGGRRIRNLEPTPACRYWCTDDLLAEIEIELKKMTPDSRSPEIDSVLLHQIHAEWSRTGYRRQRRRHDRNEIRKKASVAHGIYAVCQEVHNQAIGSVHQALEGETWEIGNQSHIGFGAKVRTELNAWLKIGRLVTLREEMNLGMSIVAVVRSLQDVGSGEIYVGVEVLSYMALYALLQDWQIDGSQPFPGVFLASDEDHGLPTSLILPAIEYQPEEELQLKLDRRPRHVRLGRLIEQQDDWCRVAVEILGD